MVPLHCTAHGKALLAGLDRTALRRIFGDSALGIYTRQTTATIADLAKKCADIQSNGYATDDAEYREGLRCVAAPIRAQKGMVVGSIGISAPLERFPAERYTEVGEQVRAIAEEISARLNTEPKE
jgi:DNA-binding IclR family transcriptional regulator